MAEHAPLPWAIRPQDHDDWGYVRGADGSVACCARGEDSSTWDRHRERGTDPYQANADLIVKAVNNHDALVRALQDSQSLLISCIRDRVGREEIEEQIIKNHAVLHPKKWDEGEHEGCGVDSERAFGKEQSRAAVGSPMGRNRA